MNANQLNFLDRYEKRKYFGVGENGIKVSSISRKLIKGIAGILLKNESQEVIEHFTCLFATQNTDSRFITALIPETVRTITSVTRLSELPENEQTQIKEAIGRDFAFLSFKARELLQKRNIKPDLRSFAYFFYNPKAAKQLGAFLHIPEDADNIFIVNGSITVVALYGYDNISGYENHFEKRETGETADDISEDVSDNTTENNTESSNADGEWQDHHPFQDFITDNMEFDSGPYQPEEVSCTVPEDNIFVTDDVVSEQSFSGKTDSSANEDEMSFEESFDSDNSEENAEHSQSIRSENVSSTANSQANIDDLQYGKSRSGCLFPFGKKDGQLKGQDEEQNGDSQDFHQNKKAFRNQNSGSGNTVGSDDGAENRSEENEFNLDISVDEFRLTDDSDHSLSFGDAVLEKSDVSELSDKSKLSEDSEMSERSDLSDNSETAESSKSSGNSESSESSESFDLETVDKSESSDNSESPKNMELSDISESSESSEPFDSETVNKSESSDNSESSKNIELSDISESSESSESSKISKSQDNVQFNSLENRSDSWWKGCLIAFLILLLLILLLLLCLYLWKPDTVRLWIPNSNDTVSVNGKNDGSNGENIPASNIGSQNTNGVVPDTEPQSTDQVSSNPAGVVVNGSSHVSADETPGTAPNYDSSEVSDGDLSTNSKPAQTLDAPDSGDSDRHAGSSQPYGRKVFDFFVKKTGKDSDGNTEVEFQMKGKDSGYSDCTAKGILTRNDTIAADEYYVKNNLAGSDCNGGLTAMPKKIVCYDNEIPFCEIDDDTIQHSSSSETEQKVFVQYLKLNKEQQ